MAEHGATQKQGEYILRICAFLPVEFIRTLKAYLYCLILPVSHKLRGASPCPLNAKEFRFPLSYTFGSGICIFQIYPLMALHIQKEILVLEFMLRRVFNHVEVDYSLIKRSFNLKIGQIRVG